MLADQQLLNSWIGGYQTEVSLGTVGGHHIVWQAPSRCTPRNLFDDGRAIVTEANGQVCFLRIYSGNQPVTVLELEKIVA